MGGEPKLEWFFGYSPEIKGSGWNWALWDSLWADHSRPPILSGTEPDKPAAAAQVKQLVCSALLRGVSLDQGIESFVAHHPQVNRYTQSYFSKDLWPAQRNPFEPNQYGFIQRADQPVWSVAPAAGGQWGAVCWPNLFCAIAVGSVFQSRRFSKQNEAFEWAFETAGKGCGQGLGAEYAVLVFLREEEEAGRQASGRSLKESDFLYLNQSPAYITVQKQWTAHKIVNQTPKIIEVLQRPFPVIDLQGKGERPQIGEVFQLDRGGLERQGYVYSRLANGYFRSQVFSRSLTSMPQPLARSLKLFALTPEVQRDELKQRYRALALKLHPDQGGNALGFKKLQAAYGLIQEYIQSRDSGA